MTLAVQLHVEDGVGLVTIDNPPVNALDDDTLNGLLAAARELDRREDVRAVVLSGAGDRAFAAGADLSVLAPALGPAGEPGAMDHHVGLTGPTFAGWSALRQPVVAALAGNAIGGGLELALVCDLIIADPHVRLGAPEVRLGLIPGAGGTQRLRRRIGIGAARELVLLGGLIDAGRAERLGLVDRIARDSGARIEARELATRLAALPALAVQGAKRALAADLPLEEGLKLERSLFLAVAASGDAREGALAFLEKRSPSFRHG